MVDGEDEDWTSYKRLVLSDLHEIKKEIHELRVQQQAHRVEYHKDVSNLKVKVSTVSGFISAMISLIGAWLSGVFR